MVPCPNSVKTVGCMWVDNRKSRFDGTADCNIAWLEAKGFNQPYELDLDVTYGPMVKFKTVKMQIAIAGSKGQKFKQMKVKEAFQHGGVDMGIYLEKPHGFEDQQKLEQQTRKIFHKLLWKLSIMMLGVSTKEGVEVITDSAHAPEGLCR